MNRIEEAIQRSKRPYVIPAGGMAELFEKAHEDRGVLAEEVERLRVKLGETRGCLRYYDNPFYEKECEVIR